MGTAGVDGGLEVAVCHPLGQPFQLAVTQQAGRVQVAGRDGSEIQVHISTGFGGGNTGEAGD